MRFTWQRILGVQYSIPDYVHISPECQDLISRIFVANPATVSTSGFVMVGSLGFAHCLLWPITDIVYTEDHHP